MAVLNIKDFPDDLQEALRNRARQERRSLAQEVIHLLSRIMERDKQHSLLELRGLGKEMWKDEDAANHVARERDAWE